MCFLYSVTFQIDVSRVAQRVRDGLSKLAAIRYNPTYLRGDNDRVPADPLSRVQEIF